MRQEDHRVLVALLKDVRVLEQNCAQMLAVLPLFAACHRLQYELSKAGGDETRVGCLETLVVALLGGLAYVSSTLVGYLVIVGSSLGGGGETRVACLDGR